jgi:hypothetical protein
LADKVNFWVLNDDGLRSVLAGDDPRLLAIASGNILPYTTAGNLRQASFRASGRSEYTIIVYNDAKLPINYVLSAQNALIVDSADQVQSDMPRRSPTAVAAPAATPTATATLIQRTAASPLVIELAPTDVWGRRLSGDLGGLATRHYFSLLAEIPDSAVGLTLDYGPLNQPELTGDVNFWVLSPDGFRRLVAGQDPEQVAIASGATSAVAPKPGELLASFVSVGRERYTVIVYNTSGIVAQYALSTQDAYLIDRLNQTREARAQVAELAAIEQSAPVEKPVSPPPAETQPQLISVSGAISFNGLLDLPYEHHYLRLRPSLRNEAVTITLDYAPHDNQTLRSSLNFWVVDEDGMRRITSGARPIDVDVATGSVVRFGQDAGKLQAAFRPTARTFYTIIVYNASNVEATYSLRIDGGTLEEQVEPSMVAMNLP